jgi:hypothetical protein
MMVTRERRMHRFRTICIFAALASFTGVAAQTSAIGQPWEGRWASTPTARHKVTCTGEADCDGMAYTFDGGIVRGVPGYFPCVIAGESSDPAGTVLPLACAAEGTPYTTAIRLKLQNDALMVQWARAELNYGILCTRERRFGPPEVSAIGTRSLESLLRADSVC